MMHGMSDTKEPRLPAMAAKAMSRPSTIVCMQVGPSPELLKFLEEHPGGKLTVRAADAPVGEAEAVNPALSIRSWREDHVGCARCGRAFSIAYGNPPDQTTDVHNVPVRCPHCAGVVAVAVPTDVDPEGLDVRTIVPHDPLA